ncbi:Xaa-Pro aminopeptidase [Hahella sp. SMD15-11]|uniref:Xaa-Pro aminopeptidase n=1 Tax=Thermohahella caldifontis TaxID=3142973 RepID=A0AB39UV59_9GAMM
MSFSGGIVNKSEFGKRRHRLLGMMSENSIAILPAGSMKTRSRDTEYVFRQDSDFWYLTGFHEPEAVLVLVPGREHGESILFCRERDPDFERWNGRLLGPEGAQESLGLDDAFPIKDMDEILPGLIEGKSRVYYTLGQSETFDKSLMGWINHIRSKVRAGARPPGEFVVLSHLIHELRLFKSAAELKVMRKAARISAEAHCRAMRASRPGLYEYQLEAEILHEFARQGAREPAYTTIVGGGANACVLHYIDNRAPLRDGDLVLIDAGCELDMYAADITRTFPVNGRFSAEQKAVYEVVLAAQLAAIEAVKPGNHWNHPHEAATRVLTQGLIDLGILQGDLDTALEQEAYKPWFMHRTGHWLGIDVHDVGDYKVGDEWRLLEPGMVLTVEPGLYFDADDERVEARWRGIGIRIEDDVVVTRDGHEVMTSGVPKTVDEIQNLMAG